MTDYLEIERVRFEERLRYVIDVPTELEAVGVPAFSVQTLVENSVKYAVAVRREGAEIRIRVATEQESVVVVVTDDGPGFASAPLAHGHGLDTLRGRLVALFGDVAALEIAGGGRDGGARVTMRLPMRRQAA